MSLNNRSDYRNVDVSDVEICGQNIVQRGGYELRLEDVVYLAEFYCEIEAFKSKRSTFNPSWLSYINHEISISSFGRIVDSINSLFASEANPVNFGLGSFVGDVSFILGIRLPRMIGYNPIGFFPALADAHPSILHPSVTLYTRYPDDPLNRSDIMIDLDDLNNYFKTFLDGSGTYSYSATYVDQTFVGGEMTNEQTSTNSGTSSGIVSSLSASLSFEPSSRTSSTVEYRHMKDSTFTVSLVASGGAVITEIVGMLCKISGSTKSSRSASWIEKTPLAYMISPYLRSGGSASFNISNHHAYDLLRSDNQITNETYYQTECAPMALVYRVSYPATW